MVCAERKNHLADSNNSLHNPFPMACPLASDGDTQHIEASQIWGGDGIYGRYMHRLYHHTMGIDHFDVYHTGFSIVEYEVDGQATLHGAGFVARTR